MDTSAVVAALVAEHEFHEICRRHLAADSRLAAIVLAETFASFAGPSVNRPPPHRPCCDRGRATLIGYRPPP